MGALPKLKIFSSVGAENLAHQMPILGQDTLQEPAHISAQKNVMMVALGLNYKEAGKL